MDIRRIIVSAVVRRLVYVCIAAMLAWCGASKAQPIVTFERCHTWDQQATCQDEGIADIAARKAVTEQAAAANRTNGKVCLLFRNTVRVQYGYQIPECDTGAGSVYFTDRYFGEGNRCSDRKPNYAGDQEINTVNPGSVSLCQGGCAYTLSGDATIYQFVSPGAASNTFGKGTVIPTGQVCTPTTPPKKPDPPETCHVTQGGHKVCKRTNGDICVTSATTGRTYCGPSSGETNATNPNRTENVNIGPPKPTPTPPTPPTPRPGEDWKPNGGATINNISNNNSNSVSLNTNAGTPNTNPNSGNPGDGSGNPGTPGNGTNGDGDGDGLKPNTVGGSGSCSSTYSCTGGDQALCAILREQHAARCSGEKGAPDGKVGELEGGMGDAIGKLIGVPEDFDVMAVLGNYLDTNKACPTNPVIDAGTFGNIELPVDTICPYLQIFGVLALCGCYLYAVKILVGG